MHGKQILAYCHGRQYDRYLATETFPYNSNNGGIDIKYELQVHITVISEKLLDFTLLKSRNNGLITVYNVSRSPYAHSNGTSLYGKYDGQGIVVHDHRFGLVRLSERGKLSYNALAFDSSEEYTPRRRLVDNSLARVKNNDSFRSDAGPLDLQDSLKPHVDLGPVYDGTV